MSQTISYKGKTYNGVNYVSIGGKRFYDEAQVNPSGTLVITSNGTFDCSKYSSVRVDVTVADSGRVTGRFYKTSNGSAQTSLRTIYIEVTFEGAEFTTDIFDVINAKYYNTSGGTSGNVPSSYITIDDSSSVGITVKMRTQGYSDISRYFEFDLRNMTKDIIYHITMENLTYGTTFDYSVIGTKTTNGYILKPA